jgi:hypothetical protein
MRRSLTALMLSALLVSACGVNQAAARHPAAGHAARDHAARELVAADCVRLHPDHGSVTLTQASPSPVCVPAHTGVYVFLHGSPSLRWSGIRSSSPILRPAPSGIFTLMRWETGAHYIAVRPGRIRLTSVGRNAAGKPARKFSVLVFVTPTT